MSIMSNIYGKKAYRSHVMGNQLSDKEQVQAADAKYQTALEYYAKCVQDPKCNHLYIQAYSVLLMRYRRFEEAMELLRRADKMKMSKEDKLRLRINYSICQWKVGKLDQGIELMKTVFNDMKNSVVYGSLGFMLIEKAVQTGDFTEAIEFNALAYDYDEEDAVILDNMGQMYYRMGDEDKALTYFERAHEIKPKQVDTLYYLGKIYSDKGRDAEAREALDTALKGNYPALCTTTREMAKELREKLG